MLAPSILLILLGVFVIYGGMRSLRAARQAMKLAQASELWPATAGRVVSSTMRIVDEGGDPPTGYCLPEVQYTYSVGNLSYTGSGIAFRDLRGSKKASQQINAKYPVGSEVSVSYDPDQPGMAVLEPGTAGVRNLFVGARLLFFVGLVLIAVAIAYPILRSTYGF